MVIREHFATREDGVELYRSYSSEGYIIQQEQTGALYSDAIDIENSGYTYIETDIMADDDVLSAEAALDILMGGTGDEQD